jgi:hypothetical protein
MNNSHDEIKQLLNASRNLLGSNKLNEDIRKQYGLLTEQGVDLTDDNITTKPNITKSVEDKIEYDTFQDDTETDDDDSVGSDKQQGYRISGGIIVLHGKNQVDLQLTTDEKSAFQETMDEFVNEVTEMVDFNKLNVFPNNVEWSGTIIDLDIEFFYSIGEENGIYINGDMIKADDEFLELINKLKRNYEKFKAKWGKVLVSRKKTIKTEE